MNEIIIELYKCLGEEVEANKHYSYLAEKMRINKKEDMAKLLNTMAEQKKEYMKDILKFIKQYLSIEYKDNTELQDLVNHLNEVMIKTFI